MSERASLPRPEDRRAATRHFYKIQAICQKGPQGLDDAIHARILNLSTTGAQLIVRVSFEPGEEFFLALVSSRRKTIADLKSTVRWLQSEGPGFSRIGVSFEQDLDAVELSQSA